MQPPAGLVIDLFRNGCRKANDIVIQRPLQFLLALHQTGEISETFFGSGLHSGEISFGHNALLYQSLTSVHFDLQPKVQLIFVSPNSPHFRARISRNHTRGSYETDAPGVQR